MNKIFNKTTGDRGEEIAVELLCSKGYKLLEKNWRCKMGELDLVMVAGNVIVFVEVKTKVGDRFGSPEEMMNAKKVWRVARMAEYYLQTHPNIKLAMRIDLVAIELGSMREVLRINHIESIT